jgi:tetratricopeptide (TPR) repeat protein
MGIKKSSQRIAWFAGIAALALASGACSRSPEAKSAKYMAEGKKMMEKKDPARAILQFQNAAHATPKDPEVFYQLALAYIGAGNLRDGISALRKTLDLNPKHPEARLRLATMMSGTIDPEILKDARERLAGIVTESPQNAQALHALGIVEFKLGLPVEALQNLELAAAAAPQELLFAINVAQAKLKRGDAKGAEAVLLKAAANSPKSAGPHTALADFYVSQRKPDAAEAQLRRALELDVKDGPALLALGKLQLALNRKGEAEQSFKTLASIRGYESSYGSFLAREGRLEQSVQEFERLAKERPGDREMRTNLVVTYRRAGRLDAAKKVLSDALRENPKDTDALLQRGELFAGSGDYLLAEADLSQVLKMQPNSAEVHYVVAKLNQARGKTQTYRQELSKALELNAYLLPVRIEAARELVSSKNPGAALALLDLAPEGQKSMTPLTVERNWALLSLGRMSEMRAGIDRGLEREKSPDLLLQDGIWKLQSGQAQAARASLESALNLNPDDLLALSALKSTYAPREAAVAVQKVKEYAAREPKSAPIQEFLGVLLSTQGDRVGARKAFMAGKAANPASLNSDLGLVQLDVLEGKLDDGRNRLSAMAANGGGPKVRLWLSILEDKKGNHTVAIEQLRKTVDEQPDNTQALNNLAYLLAEYAGKTDEALKYAQKAVELAPKRMDYVDTLGWILYHKGLYSASVPYLEQAGGAKGNVVWKYHLAMAYGRAGRSAEGRATLNDALKINPSVPEANTAKELFK